MKTIVSEIPTRKSFYTGEGTLDVGYPWLTYGAIIDLEYLVNKNAKVLEFGSGGSTIFWANNCASVKSFETQKSWYENVQKIIKKNNNNAEIILGTQEEILQAIEKEPDNYYDFVLIDSEPRKNRRLLFANASIPKLKTGGWMVVDNYYRFSMNAFDYTKWDVYTYDQFDYDFRYQGRGTRLCRKV